MQSGSILFAEASLRRNYQDLRFCPQDIAEDLEQSSARSLSRLMQALPAAKTVDTLSLHSQGLPFLQELLLPPGVRRLPFAGFVHDSQQQTGAAINMDEHLVLKATGSADDAPELMEKVRELERKASDASHPFAYDEQYGYLSYRPVLAGSGMFLGMVLHLPLLHFLKQIRPLSRDMSEQGCRLLPLSQPEGRNPAKLFLLSNAASHAQEDAQTLRLVQQAAQQITVKEQLLQGKALSRAGHSNLLEQVWRSYGLLRYARRLTTTEFLTHWSNIRLGALHGILPMEQSQVDALLQFTNDHAFLLEGDEDKTIVFRRAEEVRRALSGG